MTLLPVLTLAWAGVSMVIGVSLTDDVSSTTAAVSLPATTTMQGSTADSNRPNQTDLDSDYYEEDTSCETCVPTLYWACSEGNYVIVLLDEDAGQKALQVVYYVGFSTSLVACLVANVIYIVTRRGLKGTPYHIHWNLIATFTLYHMVFLIGFSVMPSCRLTNVHLRNLLNVLVAYLVLANFFWMLVEGLILFCIVVKSFFQEQKGRQFIKWCLLGWGAPGVLVLVWIVAERATLAEGCQVLRLEVARPNIIGIMCLVAPIFCLLLINGVVLVTVMLNISKKLRMLDHRDERKRQRRTAKSTLVLLILLGSYYALPILFAWIENPCLMVYVVKIIGSVLSSLQGLAVSTLYVFMNAEIRRVLNKRFGELNLSVMTGSTQVSSVGSASKRNCSSSSSDGRPTRRGTASTMASEAVEMMTSKPHVVQPESPQAGISGGRRAPPAAAGGGGQVVTVHIRAGEAADPAGRTKTRAGVEYRMLGEGDA